LTLTLQTRNREGAAWLRSRSLLSFLAALTVLAMLVAGLALARSRAGVLLALVAMIGALLICVAGRPAVSRDKSRWSMVRLGAGALVFAGLFATQLGLERVLSRFEQPVFENLRIPVAATTWDMALAALPLGSGMGTFVRAYAAAEPTDALFSGWVNRAHNDYAEFFLEGGFVAAAIMAAFFCWFAVRVADVWFRGFSGHHGVSRLMAQAGTITVGLLLAHSAVDYPLRTSAMAAVFAFAAALTMPPLTRAAQAEPGPKTRSRSRSQTPATAIPRSTVVMPQPGYGAGIAWPDAWKR
jgi:O-antigen ligase